MITIRRGNRAAVLLALGGGLLAASSAGAASLQIVSNWGASGVPATVSMYIYVPDRLATNPPILVLAHYCGGTAAAVFGQAKGGGIVSAADQHGFIMVVPQAANLDGSGRCWDVGSTKALTRDGGGDPHAIIQMVKYTLTKYQANAARVYATGDSSGGMMTQALLGLYPDVFRAGSAFAGVPAGCWAAGNPSGGWSSQCAGGQVTHVEQQWGDIVRAMYPGYSGPRPRVQLVHGDADPTISFKNHTEAIKEWTNVLALITTPTSTGTVTLGTHRATRQRWQNACGYVVLDAIASMGGDHGPSDALFSAEYVIPFLGLDKSGSTDPEIAQCGSAGAAGSSAAGGAPSTGGRTGAGGTSAARAGASGASTTTGGTLGASSGTASGGRFGTGGASAPGGLIANGGAPSSAGNVALGGAFGNGEAAGGNNGGAANTGGSSGARTTRSNGAAASNTTAASQTSASEDSGCSCRMVGSKRTSVLRLALALALAPILILRRRSRYTNVSKSRVAALKRPAEYTTHTSRRLASIGYRRGCRRARRVRQCNERNRPEQNRREHAP